MLRDGIKPPLVYHTTEKAATPCGGHMETGSWICGACMGTWAPEMGLEALTHKHRGVCSAEKREILTRFVPFNPAAAVWRETGGAPLNDPMSEKAFGVCKNGHPQCSTCGDWLTITGEFIEYRIRR